MNENLQLKEELKPKVPVYSVYNSFGRLVFKSTDQRLALEAERSLPGNTISVQPASEDEGTYLFDSILAGILKFIDGEDGKIPMNQYRINLSDMTFKDRTFAYNIIGKLCKKAGLIQSNVVNPNLKLIIIGKRIYHAVYQSVYACEFHKNHRIISFKDFVGLYLPKKAEDGLSEAPELMHIVDYGNAPITSEQQAVPKDISGLPVYIVRDCKDNILLKTLDYHEARAKEETQPGNVVGLSYSEQDHLAASVWKMLVATGMSPEFFEKLPDSEIKPDSVSTARRIFNKTTNPVSTYRISFKSKEHIKMIYEDGCVSQHLPEKPKELSYFERRAKADDERLAKAMRGFKL